MGKFARFTGFKYSAAVAFEKGVTRRDPSPVIQVDGTYYVWYSRTEESFDGYSASIWYATSPDGVTWSEEGQALPNGEEGAFDEHAVFTPTILVSACKYYLFYTAVPEPFNNDSGGPNETRTTIGIAEANSPRGPWVRFGNHPVLRPNGNPKVFDSMRVDDTYLIVRTGEYWMYCTMGDR